MIIRYCPQCNEKLLEWQQMEGKVVIRLQCPRCHEIILLTEELPKYEIIKKK
jgi:phage FluMu protein Com